MQGRTLPHVDTTLDDIQALFEAGDTDDALSLLDDYLDANPDSITALVLKAELCIRNGRDADFVGNTMLRLDTLAVDPERAARLRSAVDEEIRELLDRGRYKLRRDYWTDARDAFDTACALAPHDPAIPLAAGLAALNTDSVPEAEPADDSPLAILEAMLSSASKSDTRKMAITESYLQRAIDTAPPDHPAYRQAASHLTRCWLQVGRIGPVLDMLANMSHPDPALDSQIADVALRALLVAHTHAAALLRAGQVDDAADVIWQAQAAAPDLALTHLFAGEVHARRGETDAARAAYERALALVGKPIPPTPLPAAQTLWEQARAMTVRCPRCGRESREGSTACTICDQPLDAHPLLRDRLQLEGSQEAVEARTGLAEQLAAAGETAQAIEQITLAIDALPLDHAARATLRALRREWRDGLNVVEETRPLPVPLLDTWRAVGLTPDMELQVRHACAAGPAGWDVWPLKERRALVGALLDTDEPELARTALGIIFTDNPRRKSVAALRERTAAAIDTALDAHLDCARAALRNNEPDRAHTAAEAALALEPANNAAWLLLAEAQIALDMPIRALNTYRAVLVNATSDDVRAAAQLGAAHALEACRELAAALDQIAALDTPDAIRTRERIQRRQRGEPAVLLRAMSDLVMHDTLQRSAAATYTAGYFGVEVGAVRRPWEDPRRPWNEHILNASLEFIQMLGGLRHIDGDPVFGLRLLCVPHPHIPERGTIRAVLLVRVTASNAESCQQLAYNLWDTIHTILPLTQDFVYSFEPVADPEALADLLAPFEPVTLAQIVRREDVPQADGARYAVYPFTPGSLNLHNLAWALLRQPVPSMVSVHLLPTDLMPWEHAALARIMTGASEPASEEIGRLTTHDPASQWWTGMQLADQVRTNRRLVDTLRASAYVMAVNVAGSAGTNPLLPETVAATLFGALRTDGESLQGSCEVLRPVSDDERTAARRNIACLDVERWTYSAAPQGADRLRHLVGETQAAVAFRLPIPGADGVPGIPLITARPIAPPANLPDQGTVLGESVIRIDGMPLRIVQGLDDRRRHTYVVGKTGTGKSTLLKYMAVQDIEAGHGVCVIDPHGDLVEDILHFIPAHRADDVILFDPSDDERPIGLNLLEASTEQERHRIVTEFIGMLMRMYDPHQTGIVGPRFQHNVRMGMLTAMSLPECTLIEVVRALTDSQFVRDTLPFVTDPVVRNYWQKQIATTSDFHKSEILDYIVSKFNTFVGDRLVRNIVGQRHTTVDFRRLMDQRQILLVNLSKGKIGPESAQFLGLLVVQRLLITALSRADMPPEQRPDFVLYVDEFQNFATDLFGIVMSEGRKYGVAVTIANQYLTQLSHSIREAIFGNVGSIVSFRLGTQDAAALAPELYPVFSADDLLNLPKFTTCTKLLVDGVARRPFTMKTVLDSRAPNAARAALIREQSRQRYGRDADDVSEDVLARFHGER